MTTYLIKSAELRCRKTQPILRLAIATVMTIAVSGSAFGQTALDGSELILPSAAPTADMVILKTQNSSNSNVFSIAVTNTGPVAVNGALVTDTGGTSGICTKTNPVTVTINGVPAGTATIANLSAPGIVLGTIQPGQSATLHYTCQGQ
jgi:hypothetical protein